MDKKFTDLEADFKSYASMTMTQGQLRFYQESKNKVKAFIQWSRHQIRMGGNPASVPFLVREASMILLRHNTHERFVKDTSTLADAAKPMKFETETKWQDWVPAFKNYLRTHT